MAKIAPVRNTAAPAAATPRAIPEPAPQTGPVLIGRNVFYEVEGDTLVLLINISDAAVSGAPLSAPDPAKPNKVRNPVVGTTGGFKYFQGLVSNGSDLGISVNIIAKAPR